MGTLNPELQGNIYIPEPVATPSALGAIGDLVSMATQGLKARSAVQNSSQYRKAQDDSRLVGLQDGLYKADQLRKQGKKAQADQVERQVILNFARDGGDLGDASVQQTILISTGKSVEQAGRSPEEIANQQFMESSDYGPLILAGMYELGPDKTSAEYHQYAVTQKARSEALKVTIQDTSISWLEGKQQAFTDAISLFQKSSLGALQITAVQQGVVSRDDFIQAQQQWNVMKKDLTAARPIGLPEDQWKPIKDQMELMDETLTILSGMAGTAGIEAKMLNDVAAGLYSAAKEAGDRKSLLTASALINAIKERPVEVIQNWGIQDPSTLRSTLLAENRVTVPTDSSEAMPQGVKDQYKNVDATQKFNDAAALTKYQGTSTALQTTTYNTITVDHLTKAFGAMQSMSADNGQFVSVDGINKVFNGGVVASIQQVGKTAPDTARKLSEAGFEALDAQFAVATGVLQSIVEGSGLSFDGASLVINVDSLARLGVKADKYTLLKRMADTYYGGDMTSMVKDRGRLLSSAGTEDARLARTLVTSGTLGNMTTVIDRAQTQEKVVRRLDQLRNQFRELGNSFVDLEGGGGTGTTAGGAGGDRVRESREDKLNAPSTSYARGIGDDPEFVQAISNTSSRLRIDPSWLTKVMSFETGGTFNPGQKNAAGSGATGLIQFMPDTAKGLGTTVEKLAAMSRAEQMYFVEKHMSQYLANVENPTFSDVYMSVLYPAAVGKPENFVLFKKGTKAYDQNAGLDIDGSGTVTKAEAAARAWGRGGTEMTFPEASGDVYVSERPQSRPETLETVQVDTKTVESNTINTQPAATPQTKEEQAGPRIATTQEVEKLTAQTKRMLEKLQVNPNTMKSFDSEEEINRAFEAGQVEDGEIILLNGEVHMV